MADFTTILSEIIVASTNNIVRITNGFKNINGIEFLAKLQAPEIGNKDDGHFLRCDLNTDNAGICLARSDNNASSIARVLVIDCDKHINIHGVEVEGAPDPQKISQILRENNISHVLYGSYSHYVGDKGNRYRIIIVTNSPYTKDQLPATVEAIIMLINSTIDGELLANAKENNTWSQPWFYPRKPKNSNIDNLYLEYLDGKAIVVVDPVIFPPTSKIVRNSVTPTKNGEISVINAFNQQYSIIDLLSQYGYKRIYAIKEYQKFLSPNSTSGKAGITVKDNKFYSHHNDKFNDGYWHDVFDLFMGSEGLTQSVAVIKTSQITRAPDGRTVDEYNKSLAKKTNKSTVLLQPIEHAGLLNELIKKITSVDFRKAANISDSNDKLKLSHFHVTVIDTILDLAKKHNWGICKNHDFFYLYNGAYWSLIGEDELTTFLGEAAEKMQIDKFLARHYNFKDQLYKQFLASACLPKLEKPRDVVFINLKNRTFEITPTSTSLRRFNRNDFITYQLPFDYDPNATAPLFEKYLNRVLPDIELQNILSEYLGYIFIRTSTLKLEKTLILYGKGSNGKSVFYEIVRHLIGEENISQYSLQSLTDNSGYQRAMIANKLVNYVSEISGKLQTSIFKQLVSGESVEARLPYGRPFIITDYAKLIFNCNELPKDVEQTEAFFRQFLIVPFNVKIQENSSERDPQLAMKIIEAELSGILNWVLDRNKQ